LIQYQAYYNFSVSPGNTYGYDPLNQSVKGKCSFRFLHVSARTKNACFLDQWYNNLYGPGNCYDQTLDCNIRGIDSVCTAADNFCLNAVENLYDIYLERDEYDFRYLMPNPFPPSYYVDYLNTPEVQEAIGAYVNYSESNAAVGAAFGSTGDDDREIGTVAAMKKLLDQNVTVIMYFGDADFNCNWLGGQVVADNVKAVGYEKAGFVDITTSDSVVHGQVKQSGKFAFVRIYESGHLVPFFQPLVSLEMVDRVLNGFDIATGKTVVTSSYITNGTKLSTFHEGNATVQFVVTDPDLVYNTTTNAPSNATTGEPPSELKKRHEKQTKNKRQKKPYRFGDWLKQKRQADLRRWL